MILTRTPFRVSLFGGGTDYPAWSKAHGGCVLSTTINRYCWITVRALSGFQPYRYRVVYSKVEQVDDVDAIQHPAVRACLKHVGIHDFDGFAVSHDGDLPARTGVGSSSAFTVGLLHALYAHKGMLVSKDRLAREAIFVEQELLKEHVGAQDQVAVAHGGFNRIEFLRGGVGPHGGGIHVQPVPVAPDRLADLQSRLMLFYLGQRPAGETGSSVAATYDFERARPQLRAMATLVDEAIEVLAHGNIDAIGSLLHDGWRMKRELGGVSDPEIDQTYEAALAAGATGGKLIGAGRGGFLLLFVPGESDAVAAAVCGGSPERTLVPFKFEREGSTLVHYAP